jgi:hypothetical protein
VNANLKCNFGVSIKKTLFCFANDYPKKKAKQKIKKNPVDEAEVTNSHPTTAQCGNVHLNCIMRNIQKKVS